VFRSRAARYQSSVHDAALDTLYREHFGRILATIIRLTGGDFSLAEDAVQDAFAAALSHWRDDGWPANPTGWLAGTARHKALDRLRRQSNFTRRGHDLEQFLRLEMEEDKEAESPMDERLRLIFTCCHPALALEAQVALSLQTLCGMNAAAIARAFLVPESTMAQRLVRAKQKIRRARIPYEIPAGEALPERLEAVMAVIYLVFNAGYGGSNGDNLIRQELCTEAIRLGRFLTAAMPDAREAGGLLALMLLHDARRDARVDQQGDLVLLEDQERRLWDQTQIAEGAALLDHILRSGAAGPYALQAAIAALHCQAPSPAATDWPQIAALYARLVRIRPSPVVELNRAVAVAMVEGCEAGLNLIDALKADLGDYYLWWATRADLDRRLQRWEEAAEAYREALSRVSNGAEERFLRRRLNEVEALASKS
jgi:RNA polymerase sigma-70 factor (ECF subfamily)